MRRKERKRKEEKGKALKGGEPTPLQSIHISGHSIEMLMRCCC